MPLLAALPTLEWAMCSSPSSFITYKNARALQRGERLHLPWMQLQS
jgi:hypothetical protein